MIEELVRRNRSYRRFYQDERVSSETLKYLVNLARLSASSANRQPLKYILSSDKSTNESIFSSLSWAGYLKDWKGPDEGEKPAAYIVILGDKEISANFSCDHGIAAQSILLGAVEKGLGGCIVGSINRKSLSKSLSIEEKFEILLVLAIGKPKESVQLTEVADKGGIEYWRDDNGIHYVPKRALEDIIVLNKA